MPAISNTQRLKELMSQHNLKIVDVAALLGRSVQTVKEWRCANSNNIPDHLLELLQFKLVQREVSV